MGLVSGWRRARPHDGGGLGTGPSPTGERFVPGDLAAAGDRCRAHDRGARLQRLAGLGDGRAAPGGGPRSQGHAVGRRFAWVLGDIVPGGESPFVVDAVRGAAGYRITVVSFSVVSVTQAP